MACLVFRDVKISPLSVMRETSFWAVDPLTSRVLNLTFLFCGKIFLSLVVLPRERLAHHRPLTTSAAQQGRSVPTFHEGCLLETPSTSVSREGHGISKVHHITLLQPHLPCLMARASRGDHQTRESSASLPPSLCAGENEWQGYMRLAGALVDGRIGAGLKVYEVALWGNGNKGRRSMCNSF